MKLANPAPLGLFGFALTTWMLSMINAGWFPAMRAAGAGHRLCFRRHRAIRRRPDGDAARQHLRLRCLLLLWRLLVDVRVVRAVLRPRCAAAFVGWWLFMWGVFTC